MKFSKILLGLILSLFISTGSWSQNSTGGKISGTVTSASGEAVSGVALLLQGTPKGAMTDLDGKFELVNLPAGTHILQISHLGFKNQEMEVNIKASEPLELHIVLEERPEQFEAVLVKGKSLNTRVREQAYNVSAISTAALNNSTQDALQVLNRVSGVRILEDGGLGSETNFTLNGFSGDQVKFFLDGIPMDHFGSSLGLGDISVNSIDRIEVYKGVVPVWLGTDALGGAVNIITNQSSNFLDASYSIGSFNTHRASVNGAYTNQESGFTLRGNINYNYSDNNYDVWVPIREGNTIVDIAEVERFHDRYRSASATVETGVVNKKYADKLLFGFIAGTNDKEVQHGATMNSVYGGITHNSESIIPSLKYSKKDLLIEGLDVSLYSAYNLSSSEIIDTLRGVRYNWLGDTIYTPGSNDGELSRTFTTMDDKDFSSRFNAGMAFNEKHSVALNYSFSHFTRESFDTENPGKVENQFPKTLTKHVAGLAYKYDPNDKWSATLFGKAYSVLAKGSKEYDFGLDTQRIDSFQETKSSIGYGIATSYFLLPDLQLKASYEHTFRMPTALEMFGDGLFVTSNPELGPEQSDNINLSADFSFDLENRHFFSLGSSFIYRNAEDLIYQVVKVASPQTHYDNLSETRTLGVEGNFSYEWEDFFRLGANVTFQDITDQADFVYNESYTNTGYQKNYQKGFRVPNIPYFFGNANAGVSFKNLIAEESLFNIDYRFNYVKEYFLSWAELGSRDSKKLIPTQFSHDLEFTYSLNQGKYNISLEVENLTDERLYDKYYLQKPGRAFFLKLRYAL